MRLCLSDSQPQERDDRGPRAALRSCHQRARTTARTTACTTARTTARTTAQLSSGSAQPKAERGRGAEAGLFLGDTGRP